MLPKIILIDIISPKTSKKESESRIAELENLVNTYGGFVIIKKIQRRQMPDYKTYIGKGKVEEIVNDALELKADYVMVNNILKPQQLYNLEHKFEKLFIKTNHKVEVWDRVDLILKIFAKHATTKEAKLQIELASLSHLGPRISKMGLELTRQGGGIGTRGAGETNIEKMKRHISSRKHKIKTELNQIEKGHERQRNERKKHGFKTVAIVGYTNAGKSELLKSLTKKEVKVKNELFATLDSRVGKLYLPNSGSECLVSDTIGFIRDLPPDLIHAFHSTLSETINADLLLHVIDIKDKEMNVKMNVVNETLKIIKCEEKETIHVFNKVDAIKIPNQISIPLKSKAYSPVFISAKEKINLKAIKDVIELKIKE